MIFTSSLYQQSNYITGILVEMTLSLSYSLCVQYSQTSKLLTFRENLDLNFFLWSPCWSSCSFSVLYFILLYPTLLVSLDCPFSSLPLSVFSNVLFIFHCAWSKITLPPRKKPDVTSVNFSVMAVITTHRCENIYPMLFVSLDCPFSSLPLSIFSNVWLYIPYCVF